VLTNFADVLSHATQVGSGVVITQDANMLTLNNVTMKALASTDFTFVQDRGTRIRGGGRWLSGSSAGFRIRCGLAGAGGFEPPVAEPKSAALPLGYAPSRPAVRE
jgi:hypothetical protein